MRESLPIPRRSSTGRSASAQLESMVRWYGEHIYGRVEGGEQRPFYCDRRRVGAFAVSPDELARGTEEAVFRVLVTLAMYQSRRDVDIMAIQRAIPHHTVMNMTNPVRLQVLVEGHRCHAMESAQGFDDRCDVRRANTASGAACLRRPRTACHVKEATGAIGRMGYMGMIPTSAWLHLRAMGGFGGILARAEEQTDTPAQAADFVVVELSKLHRIGVKLATMIVSALSVPAIAAGLTPWWPRLDGNHLVVVDANVARAIDALRPRGPRTPDAYASWFRRHAAEIDLRRVHSDWPRTSPRLVQQAVYWFRSRSNRSAVGATCADAPCATCVARVCPFA